MTSRAADITTIEGTRIALDAALTANPNLDVVAWINAQIAKVAHKKAAYNRDIEAAYTALLIEVTTETETRGIDVPADCAARFDISETEAQRIADASVSEDDFVAIWENDTWWLDQ